MLSKPLRSAGLFILIASFEPSGATFASQSKEVVIREPTRATHVWRTFGGMCGKHRYELTISPGKRLSESFMDAKVDGVSRQPIVERALAKWQGAEGRGLDVVIQECEATRARIRVIVTTLPKDRALHFYDFWLGTDGSVDLVGES